jgi:hypothetical protein
MEQNQKKKNLRKDSWLGILPWLTTHHLVNQVLQAEGRAEVNVSACLFVEGVVGKTTIPPPDVPVLILKTCVSGDERCKGNEGPN